MYHRAPALAKMKQLRWSTLQHFTPWRPGLNRTRGSRFISSVATATVMARGKACVSNRDRHAAGFITGFSGRLHTASLMASRGCRSSQARSTEPEASAATINILSTFLLWPDLFAV